MVNLFQSGGTGVQDSVVNQLLAKVFSFLFCVPLCAGVVGSYHSVPSARKTKLKSRVIYTFKEGVFYFERPEFFF